MTVKAFSPEDAKKSHVHIIPDEVLEAVNDLLAVKYRKHSKSITIYVKEVVDALVAKGFDREKIFEDRLLDFEGVYEKAGWKVVFTRPSYNETGEQYWTLTDPK